MRSCIIDDDRFVVLHLAYPLVFHRRGHQLCGVGRCGSDKTSQLAGSIRQSKYIYKMYSLILVEFRCALRRWLVKALKICQTLSIRDRWKRSDYSSRSEIAKLLGVFRRMAGRPR